MLDAEIVEKLEKIYKERGEFNQFLKLAEEIKELKETTPQTLEWLEELSDVWVVLSQHILANKEITFPIIKNKIKRTLERIESGYFDQPGKI